MTNLSNAKENYYLNIIEVARYQGHQCKSTA